MQVANGWYKAGHSEFASAVVAAKQPGKPNTHRICADYTAVNKCAVEDWYPVKNTQEVTQQLPGNKVYHSIDICKAYLQLKLTPFASRLLAVTTPCGIWLPTTAPFQFMNLPGAWNCWLTNLRSRPSPVDIYSGCVCCWFATAAALFYKRCPHQCAMPS